MIKNILAGILATWSIFWFSTTMLLFYIPFLSIYLFFKEPRRTHLFIKASRWWMATYFPLVGCPLRIKGKEHFAKGENYIVVCNHNSFIDVPVSSPGIPGGNKTIAKSEMAKIPLFGLVYRMGSVLVDRKSESSRRDSFNKMKGVLQMGLHMCIYPEGSRNKTEEPLKPFHDGAFKLAIETKKAIIPTLLFNTKKILPAYKKFYFWPKPLMMHFLEPIAITEDYTVEQLKQKVFEVMKAYYLTHSNLQ
jgi:1-acyl-sn-glycerol-3-phosphate acyltransferase